LHPDRQRHGVHHPALRRQPARHPGPQQPRARAAPARHRAEELPTQPPHHLREGRTVPADHEEVAGRATRPAHHGGRDASPARPVRRRLQPPPTAPRPPPPGTPPAAPTTEPAATGSTRAARSPCATTAGSTPSASAEPTPEPTSSSWSR